MQSIEELLKLWNDSAMTQLESETLTDLLISQNAKLKRENKQLHTLVGSNSSWVNDLNKS